MNRRGHVPRSVRRETAGKPQVFREEDYQDFFSGLCSGNNHVVPDDDGLIRRFVDSLLSVGFMIALIVALLALGPVGWVLLVLGIGVNIFD